MRPETEERGKGWQRLAKASAFLGFSSSACVWPGPLPPREEHDD